MTTEDQSLESSSASRNCAAMMVYFTHGGGRACNQMLNSAHLYAVMLEDSGKVAIQSIPAEEFRELFPLLAEVVGVRKKSALRGFVRFCLWLTSSSGRARRKLMERILPAILRCHPGVLGVDWCGSVKGGSALVNEPLIDTHSLAEIIADFRRRGSQSIAIGGWGLRDWGLVMKYRTEILSSIKGANPYLATALKHIRAHCNSQKQLVGVLIRQTDYRRWQEGRYFFSTSDYVNVMRHLAASADYQFLVATDEVQDSSAFLGLDVVFASGKEAGRGHFMESFFELSLCTAILSPPSSFALMAAFIGNNQVIPMTRKTLTQLPFQPERLAVSDCISDPDYRNAC